MKMGLGGLPLYGTDINTAIEAVEKLTEKIKSGKYDKKTLLDLAVANTKVIEYAIVHED